MVCSVFCLWCGICIVCAECHVCVVMGYIWCSIFVLWRGLCCVYHCMCSVLYMLGIVSVMICNFYMNGILGVLCWGAFGVILCSRSVFVEL